MHLKQASTPDQLVNLIKICLGCSFHLIGGEGRGGAGVSRSFKNLLCISARLLKLFNINFRTSISLRIVWKRLTLMRFLDVINIGFLWQPFNLQTAMGS